MRAALVALAVLPVLSLAQTPNMAIKVDVTAWYQSITGGSTKLRWYDRMGRHSTIGIGMNLEPGYYVLVTERLETIRGDSDRDQIDEAYIEDPGSWRLGRQYVPFGQRNLIHEAAIGARVEIPPTIRDVPASIAVCDNGRGRSRGFVARIGSRLGISAAVGENFGATATSLNQIRTPETSPGKGRGFRVIVGADISQRLGPAVVDLEYVALRRGHTAADLRDDITDLRATIRGFDAKLRLTGAWTRSWKLRQDFYRVESELSITKNVSAKTFFRFRGGQWSDLGMGVRVRL